MGKKWSFILSLCASNIVGRFACSVNVTWAHEMSVSVSKCPEVPDKANCQNSDKWARQIFIYAHTCVLYMCKYLLNVQRIKENNIKVNLAQMPASCDQFSLNE